MKKIMITMVSIFLLAACNGDLEVDIQYELTANIDVSTIVQGMRDYTNYEYYTRDQDTTVHLTYLIYDELGELVYESRKELLNFFEKISFSTSHKSGNYTVVTWACIGYRNNPTWLSEGEYTINTLKLSKADNIDATHTPVLGVSKTVVSLDNSKEILIDVPTVGCFYTCLASYGTILSGELLIGGRLESDSYMVLTEKSDIIYDDIYMMWAYNWNISPAYSGAIIRGFSLPMEQTVVLRLYSTNNVLLRQISIPFRAEAGKHLRISVDLDSGVFSVNTMTNSASLIENNNSHQELLDIGKMKAEPARLAPKQLD